VCFFCGSFAVVIVAAATVFAETQPEINAVSGRGVCPAMAGAILYAQELCPAVEEQSRKFISAQWALCLNHTEVAARYTAR